MEGVCVLGKFVVCRYYGEVHLCVNLRVQDNTLIIAKRIGFSSTRIHWQRVRGYDVIAYVPPLQSLSYHLIF